MFRASSTNSQIDLFNNVEGFRRKRYREKLNDPNAWQSLLLEQITRRVPEERFAVLFDEAKGRPNAPIRLLVAMLILREGFGWSDEQLFETVHFHLVKRRVLGLTNLTDDVPVESTYYSFKQRLYRYQLESGNNLLHEVFHELARGQAKRLGVVGEKLRMDRAVLDSDLPRCTRLQHLMACLQGYHSRKKKLKYRGQFRVQCWANKAPLSAATLALVLALGLGAAYGFEPPAGAPDLFIGKEINEVCAGCHGDYGQGGKDGEYPRIAGLPIGYLFHQVKQFQQNIRANLPMLEHVHERQMSDEEIRDVSAYLAAIALPSRLPPMDENDPRFDAYERMLATKRVVQIPPYPGDAVVGRKHYNRECRSCHGANGVGDARAQVPPLAGQYSGYLLRQMEKFRAGQRIHDPDDPADDTLAGLTREALEDVLAYLSGADD